MIPRKTKDDKVYVINMNVYKGANRFVNNEACKNFKPDKIEIFRANKIKVTYFVEKKSKILFDPHNVTNVIEKFFADWLVKMKMIPDDNFLHYVNGGSDGINGCKENRVIAYIEVIE